VVCHEAIKEKMDRERAHDPAEEDCMNCHAPHLSAQTRLLSEPLHDLCEGCHDLEDEAFQESHIYIQASVMNCTKCHAPHASKDRDFFKEKMHKPFVERSCEECHVVSQGQ
jgi:predicted CXXCH cytochrome family protein